ncbi:MAG: YqzL family protein [Mahellales bacterium]
MLNIDLVWRIFEETGSLNAYLLYKRLLMVH